jgi:hypothetical protein
MVGTGNIAIFLLATTLRNSYENRIKPIMATWGADISHLYFVMGTNNADKPFLDKTCRNKPHTRPVGMVSTGPIKIRPLVVQGQMMEYDCPVPNSRINVLFTTNCTGTYFGRGPTCRCEESIRFFLYEKRFQNVEWFMFIDDDLYIRPTPLMSFLRSFDERIHQSIAIIRGDVRINSCHVFLFILCTTLILII